jgi:hypothetical protein
MNIVGRIRRWWTLRNAVPEDKAKLLNERIARLFDEGRTTRESPRLARHGEKSGRPVHTAKA